MQKLRNQIIESFFNPVLHFLPLTIFMVLEDFYGDKPAIISAMGVNAVLLVYIFLRYRRMILWFLGSTVIFLIISHLIIFIKTSFPDYPYIYLASEFIVLSLFGVSLLFRKLIENVVIKFSPRNFSMLNNLSELFRFMTILTILIAAYLTIDLLVSAHDAPGSKATSFIHGSFVSLLAFIFIYEIIRVTIVRVRLIKEEWWPVVNEQGKKIGSIHSLTSLRDGNKYMHPIIRVFLIDKNKILLQKRSVHDIFAPGYWDTAISNHVRLNEKVEQCILRTSFERYGVTGIKPVFLTHYTYETPVEFVYAYVFVSCGLQSMQPDPKHIESIKWWTIKQIEENLITGIFSETFELEFKFLKRSGLIDTGFCTGDCALKKNIADKLQHKSVV